jgi:hypothetical protein
MKPSIVISLSAACCRPGVVGMVATFVGRMQCMNGMILFHKGIPAAVRVCV